MGHELVKGLAHGGGVGHEPAMAPGGVVFNGELRGRGYHAAAAHLAAAHCSPGRDEDAVGTRATRRAALPVPKVAAHLISGCDGVEAGEDDVGVTGEVGWMQPVLRHQNMG